MDCFHLQPSRLLVRTTATEDLGKRVSELSTHGTVEDEIHRIVEERHHVENVSNIPVHFFEEVFDEGVTEREDTLWQLSQQKQSHNSQ